jgi:hypothetical protein
VPVFDYNYFDKHTVVKGNAPVAAGEATVEVAFDYQGEKPGGPAAITLKVGGRSVAEGKMTATVPGRFGIDTFGVGEDTGQPVTPAYRPPFPFNGTVEKVTIGVR